MNELSPIVVGGQTYLRQRVTARLQPVQADQLPESVRQANRTVASSLWQDGDNPDLVWTQFILDTEGANLNWDYMPRPALLANYATARFKPMDMEHVIQEQGSLVYSDKKNPPAKNTIFGVMTYAALADINGNLLSSQELQQLKNSDDPQRPMSERLSVVAWAALYSFLFPKTVASLVQSIGAGQMHVSMERWIRAYDYLVHSDSGLVAVPAADASNNGIENKWQTHQLVNGQPVWRRSLSFVYGGVASTTNPANQLASFLTSSVEQPKAAASRSDVILENLLTRHSEVHLAFAVSTSDEHRQGLIEEHRRLTRAIAAYVL